MDYIEKWERMRAESKRRSEEQERITVHTRPNPYGYQININHPLIKNKWNNFRREWKAGNIPTDKPWDDTERRLEFERQFMASNYYQKCIEQEKEKFGSAYEFINYIGGDKNAKNQD